MLAYLVIRDDTKWSDVFRLVPGRKVTIGRAPNNAIVIKDEKCSRFHAELFNADGRWTVRDLDSRNGTIVGTEPIDEDKRLDTGDVIRIGKTQLAYVNDLSSAYNESSASPAGASEPVPEAVHETPFDTTVSTITHRRGQTRFLDPADHESVGSEIVSVPKVGQAATKLCRLALELASQPDAVSVANIALNAVFEEANVDGGAVLLNAPPIGSDLAIVAVRTDRMPKYQRVSSFLADTVLRDGEAFIARNVQGDSTVSERDSQGAIYATSVICAPIKQDDQTVGLIHLYSTDPDKVPDPDDLEFTLAVAVNVAMVLKNLGKQEALVEDLSVTKNEIDQLRRRLGVESEIVGRSAQMEKVHQEISRAAPTNATVLIRGESGVGKELVARAVHFSSPRQKGPFVCLNCAALTETLLESELFGHEKGAFTGATDRKIGKFEAADKGTLMLDEIGEMSQAIQAKFLRVLEGHPFERVGGSKPIKVDVRVIAATNRDLEKAVTKNEFRRDLYFRLRVVEILVPPLRRRPDDVVELSEYFVRRFNGEMGRKIRGFATDALQLMREYRWPGNVRELRNVIENAMVLAQGDFIQAHDLKLTNLSTASESNVLGTQRFGYQPASLAEVERQHIQATLNATQWNKSRAASILGIERSTLDRKIRRYEIIDKRTNPQP